MNCIASGLRVYFGRCGGKATPEGRQHWGRTDGKDRMPAWRVGVLLESGRLSGFPMAFARKQDAESAMGSIEGLIDWSGTLDEVRARVLAYGAGKIRMAMVEAMAW